MKLVYLDTMYWVRLVEPTAEWPEPRLAVLREELTHATRFGTLGLVLGASVADELSRLHQGNALLFNTVVRAAEEFAGNRVLQNLKALSTFEVVGGQPLRDREAFLNGTQRRRMWAALPTSWPASS